MLSLQTSDATFCDGMTRREMLRVGGLGALFACAQPSLFSWLGTNPLLAATTGPNRFGQAKSVILVTLYGGPPQTETFDMKPTAPVEARGPFKPIQTNVVDLHICEHLPRLAQMADRYTIVRSFSHKNTAHATGLYTFLTGWPHPIPNQNSPASPDDYPHFGSLVSKLAPPREGLPASTILGGKILPQFNGIGQRGGLLGDSHDPVVVDRNPSGLLTLQDGIPVVRMDKRRRLLDQLQAVRPQLDQHGATFGFSAAQEQAFRLLESDRFMSAFDLDAEPGEVRDRYGRSKVGENILLARRLVEAGVPVIQVSDIPKGGEQHWDLHYSNIFSSLQNKLLPNLDKGVSALLTDLDQRGLLDETLVVVGGEFGRTPWMDHGTNPPQGGRQHWPFCYSMLFAGGGIRRGEVFGKSDEIAAYPMAQKVAPWDFAATLLHLMGIDPTTKVKSRQGEMFPICRGHVIRGII